MATPATPPPSNDGTDDSKLQDDIDSLNAQITKQGAMIRTLKKEGAAADSINEAVVELQKLKIHADELLQKQGDTTEKFNRKSFDDLILRKMFIVSSFEIHGGVKGLYDLGPPACSLKVRYYKCICVYLYFGIFCFD